MVFELRLAVSKALMLPQRVSSEKLAIRANAVLEVVGANGQAAPRRQETDPGTWNMGTRARDVSWTAGRRQARRSVGESAGGPNGVLVWRLEEDELKFVKAYRPKLKVYLYACRPGEAPSLADAEPLGWLQVDVRDLQAQRLSEAPLALRGVKGEATPIRLVVSARLAALAAQAPSPERPEALGVSALPTALESQHLSALPIGEGRSKFEVEVTLESCEGLLSLGPELEGMGLAFWFSYELFGMVLQTDRFSSLAAPNLSVTTDTFRLAGSLHELEMVLRQSAPLAIFLCSDQIVLAAAQLSFPEVGSERSPAGSLAASTTFSAALAPQRLGALAGAAFLRVRIQLRSEGPVEEGEPCADLSAFLDQSSGGTPVGSELGGVDKRNEEMREGSGDRVSEGGPQQSDAGAASLIDITDEPRPTLDEPAPAAPSGSSGGSPAACLPVPPAGPQVLPPVEALEPSVPSPQPEAAPLNTQLEGSSEATGGAGALSPSALAHEESGLGAIDNGVARLLPAFPVARPTAAPQVPPPAAPASGPTLPPSTHPPAPSAPPRYNPPQPPVPGPGWLTEAQAEAMSESLAEAKFRRLKHQWRGEWEEWQRREEAAWSEQLRSRESARAGELEEAFQQREAERAAVVARSQAEYVRLEAKLRSSLGEVEARERRLAAAEENLKQAHAQKLSELQLLQRRLREENRHQVRLFLPSHFVLKCIASNQAAHHFV